MHRIEISDRLSKSQAASQVDTSGIMRGEIITSRKALLALESDWRALELDCPDTVLFQSFDWCHNYLEFRCEHTNVPGSFLPQIIAIRQGDTLVGLLPLALQKKGRMHVLTGFSEPFQQYTEILLKRGCDLLALQDAFLEALKSTPADYLHFGQVRQDGQLACLLDGIATPSGELDAAPFVDLKPFDSFEAYLKTVRAKTRKNLRNARNRLEREAPVTHEIARRGTLVKEVVARAYEGREAWLERLGITSRAFRDDDFEAFLQYCARTDEAHGVETIAMSLKHGDVPISDQWGFVYRGRYYAFMAIWNPDYEAFSPGRMHLGEVLKSCFDEDLKTADFMIPASKYKLTWTDKKVEVRDFVRAISFRGQVYAALWLNFARPLSKKIFFKLPVGLRGLLVKRVLPGVE